MTRVIPIIVIIIFAMILLVACGPTTRERAIHQTFSAANAARDGFIKWDDIKQQEIVGKATSLEDGKTKLANYRKRRMRIVEMFESVYRLTATALIVNDDPTSFANLMSAAQTLKTELEKFVKE